MPGTDAADWLRREGMTLAKEENPRLVELLRQVRNGSQKAAAELVRIYSPSVLRVVRRMLNPRLRNKFDSDDFTQAVWASFFAQPARWAELRRPEQLIGLLQRMARNKVVDEHRRRMATHKYSVTKERPLPSADDGPQEWLIARQPSPSQLAMARERWNRLLVAQSPQHQNIIRLKLGGMTNRSVAARLGVSEKTVQRVLQRLMRRSFE
jgi:RNA polymerase sigma factor (sigma-70 family)